MPKASPLQESFLSGELSPFTFGRVSSDRYKEGLEICLNYLPLLQGALTRRPGSYFVCEVNDSEKDTIIQRFEFSTTQAYILEFGDLYVRFVANHGQVVETGQAITGATNANPCVITYSGADNFANGDEVVISGIVGAIGSFLNGRNFKVASVNTGANTFALKYMDGTDVNSTLFGAYGSGGTIEEVYTVTTPYTEAQLRKMSFVQSADVLYIAHESHAPRKLSRIGATNWTLTAIDFIDGPYLPIDTSGITITPSNSTSLTPNLTASSALWASTDVGRHVRLNLGGTWKWMKITGFSSSTVVTVVRTEASAIGTSALSTWRLGIWSDTTGYPSCVAFHEDRLCFGGAPANRERFDMSMSGDYDAFSPSAEDGTVPDNYAVSRSLQSDEVHSIFWMKSEEKALLMGTPGGEFAVRPSVQSEAISPSNINAKRISSFGSAQMAPVVAGKSTLYVQGTKRTMREISYFYEEDGFLAPNRTILADHVSGALGFLQIAHQKEKPSIVWCVREDGVVAGMTYEREGDTLIVSWHRHIFGGVSDEGNTDAKAESVAVIPSPDGTRSEAYFVVQRLVNGRIVKTIEYLTKPFEHDDEQKDAFFVDCGLTYDAPVEVSNATQANPCVVTATSHGFNNGDVVLFEGVLGMEELNGNSYTVRNKTTHTFELEAMNGVAVNSTAFTAYAVGGFVRKYVTTLTGLWHLEGQEVDILGDGGVQPTKTVTNGAITLQNRATTVHIGLPYLSRGKMLRPEAGSADGAAFGKTRRVSRVNFGFYRTLGFTFGTSFENLEEITFRTNNDPDGRAPSLYSGIKSQTIDSDHDFEGQVCWQQSRPVPGTLLAVGLQMVTEDR